MPTTQPPPAKDKLIIFDTSLRDGEQSPGVTLTADEKVEIARQLSRLGVDVCEAGFPVASVGDFEAVQRIAKEVGPLTQNRKSGKPMVIAGLARAVPADIQRAHEAVKHAPLHRIHTFLATSDIHLQHKLRITREECIARAVAAVSFARSLGVTDVEFSPEDAGRSDKEFLCAVLGAVIAAGATTLNIPDTVGYNTPEEYGALIKHLREHTVGAEKVVWSTHCHNDLGLATANTLAGVRAGARQVEVTINGIGERAGNTALEEVVMAIQTHPNYFPVHTNDVDTQQIYLTSQLITKKTGMPLQPNKAIVGANAFSHESGIHQDGMLKNRETYEIMQPEKVGIPSSLLVLGKHSGRNAFRSRLESMLGESVYGDRILSDPARMDALFAAFKKLADSKKRGVTEQDLYALLDDQLNSSSSTGLERYRLKSLQVFSGTGVLATATVTLLFFPPTPSTSPSSDEETVEPVEKTDAAIGHGPVHAIFSTLNRITGVRNVLASYEVKSVSSGSDSLGKVVVSIREEDSASEDGTSADGAGGDKSSPLARIPSLESGLEQESPLGGGGVLALVGRGEGVDEDILVASAKAYINALNRLLEVKRRREELGKVGGSGNGEVSVVGGSVPAVPKSRKVDV
ncbi:hypothetical protein HDV05_000870 [Chytridiales sp. JEL 0842]|nr:hypothetical protein HDV05_000870 [Chytridiales sp. JEL 0842]